MRSRASNCDIVTALLRELDGFPELSSYLAELPNGVDSYPSCQAKASLYRSVADARPIAPADIAKLPAALQRLLDHPVPISSWISEVHSHAVLLAIYDRCFSSRQEFAEFAYQRQKVLFGGRIYSVALRVVSPTMLVKTAALRFGMFHRGVGFTVVDPHPGGVKIVIDHPSGVYDEISRVGLCEGLRAVLDLCMGGGTFVNVQDATKIRTLILAGW